MRAGDVRVCWLRTADAYAAWFDHYANAYTLAFGAPPACYHACVTGLVPAVMPLRVPCYGLLPFTILDTAALRTWVGGTFTRHTHLPAACRFPVLLTAGSAAYSAACLLFCPLYTVLPSDQWFVCYRRTTLRAARGLQQVSTDY